jgi:uncharacterized protein
MLATHTRLALLLLASLAPGAAAAQEIAATALPPHVRVTAEAMVTAQPDRARVDVGVLTQAPQSQAAAADNARQLEAVLKALRRRLGDKAEIRTVSYSLNPVYHYPRDGEPRITGYQALNVVRITLDDLALVGVAIDVAAQNGANQVQRIEFTLSDEHAVRSQALREAAGKARARAESLADALGMRLVRVLSVTDGSPPMQPIYQRMEMARGVAAMADRPETPVQPGTIEVNASVTLVVEIAAR